MEAEDYKSGWICESWNALERENYPLVVNIYENEVELDPTKIQNIFYLGLAYLLNGEEELAHMAWFSVLSEDESTENSNFIELSNILAKEAFNQSKRENYKTSWIIRRHLKELNNSNIENLIELGILSIQLNIFSIETLHELNFVEAIQSIDHSFKLEEDLFERFINQFLKYEFTESIEIVSVLAKTVENKKNCVNIILSVINKNRLNNPEFSGQICKICSDILPKNIVVLQNICQCFSASLNFEEAIKSAKMYYETTSNSNWQIVSLYLLIREMMRGGEWIGLDQYKLEYKNLLYTLSEHGLDDDNPMICNTLAVRPSLLQYFQDDLVENRFLQNALSKLFLKKFNKNFVLSLIDSESFLINPSIFINRINIKKTKIKIGFLVSNLKTHPVGWLSRWFFNYYDREQFDFSIFIINQSPGDGFTQKYFESKVDKCTYFSEGEFKKVAESIYLDKVDILIDMDSTTSYDACRVLALKPAPIQATWLGFDSTGIPTVDYFIVDPYLLPENAQDYYREKLWRLPQTYLAVDGFEVEVPTLYRKDLDIPDDAVVYISAQTGQKRHPETIRLQLKIVKAVPNSYLLIKGVGYSPSIQALFIQLAQEEEIDVNRLRFLPLDQNEFIHRANLQIADVILDTYPYNGATTTLEALWVGMPVVTRLGQQCAARNSYTFLTQVGVTDGIAISDEEYVDWGIRFGKDLELRQKVYAQLNQARHTSSLWDTKKFTREMESALLEMWDIYSKPVN